VCVQGVVRSPGFEPGSEAWQAYGDACKPFPS